MIYYYLYGISLAATPEMNLPTGILNHEILALSKDKLCGYYSKIVGTQAELAQMTQFKAQNSANHPGLEHHRVVDHLALRADLLPCAYFTCLNSEDQLYNLLAQNQSILIQQLDKIKDQCEWVLKIKLNNHEAPSLKSPPRMSFTAPNPSSTPGTQYILQKIKEKQQKANLEEPYRTFYEKIVQKLKTSYTEISPFEFLEKEEMIKIFFLIPKKNLPNFQKKLKAYQAMEKEMQWLSSGPWPCYYFAQINLPQP